MPSRVEYNDKTITKEYTGGHKQVETRRQQTGLEHVAQEEASVITQEREKHTPGSFQRKKSQQKHEKKSLNKCVSAANQLELKKKDKCTFGKPWKDKTTA